MDAMNGGIIRNMIQDGRQHYEKILLELDKASQHLEATAIELTKREKLLQERETQSETERAKFDKLKRMNEMETLKRKTIELEKINEAKQTLENEIEKLRSDLDGSDHHEVVELENNNIIDELKKMLKEKEDGFKGMEKRYQDLVVRESKVIEEFQVVRKALIIDKEIALRAAGEKHEAEMKACRDGYEVTLKKKREEFDRRIGQLKIESRNRLAIHKGLYEDHIDIDGIELMEQWERRNDKGSRKAIFPTDFVNFWTKIRKKGKKSLNKRCYTP